MPEVQAVAMSQWERAGRQYEEENEKELKNELDYGLVELPHYPLSGTLSWLGNGNLMSLICEFLSLEKRPSVGCRHLMQRESGKMIPAILKELHDWNSGVRMQAASLLYQLVRHLEAKNIQQLPKLWPDLCLKCADDCDVPLQNKVKKISLAFIHNSFSFTQRDCILNRTLYHYYVSLEYLRQNQQLIR
jgi:hypothetical protein